MARGLDARGRGYCVVRMNSTSGPYIAEPTSRDRMRSSIADVASCWTTRREAKAEASRINRRSLLTASD